MEARLILDRPAAGSWNMAADEWLLEWAAKHQSACLRFYGWSSPTLSLGYFQGWDERQSHSASFGCDAVRRATGGGAILHDIELTYSFVAPTADRLLSDHRTLYDAFHDSLVAELHERGIRAARWSKDDGLAPAVEPFLCFERRSDGDVVLGGFKVGGSAQRRHRGAILQHGSVLLARSSAAPELPGIEELAGRRVDGGELARDWRCRLSRELGLEWHERTLEMVEIERVRVLECSRYACEAWNRRR